MKKNVLVVLALATLTFASCKKDAPVSNPTEVSETPQNAVSYNLATEESVINWKGEKMSGDNHTGDLKLSEGAVSVVDGKLTNGVFVIDMNSITVTDIPADDENNGYLVGHLKGSNEENQDHFFNVAKYPTAKFEIANVTETENEGKVTIEGNLTLKETTKPVKFDAVVTVTDNDVLITTEEFAFDRTEFGVNYNSGKLFQDLGDKVIKDEVKVKLSVKATK